MLPQERPVQPNSSNLALQQSEPQEWWLTLPSHFDSVSASRMKTRCFVVFLSLLTWASAQTTIYFEDFSGSRENSLNGVAPSIRPGSETWLAGTGEQSWKADGYTEGENDQNAFLSFSPEAGHIYTLLFATGPTGGTGNWLGIGFTPSADVNGFFPGGLGAVAWMLVRDKRESVNDGIGTFLGPDTEDGEAFWAADGLVEASIVLDTSDDEWRVQWFVGSTLLREAAFVGENPEINYIAIGKFGDISGRFEYVSLTKTTPIPEPASVAVFLGAAVGVIAVALRRRRAPRA